MNNVGRIGPTNGHLQVLIRSNGEVYQQEVSKGRLTDVVNNNGDLSTVKIVTNIDEIFINCLDSLETRLTRIL